MTQAINSLFEEQKAPPLYPEGRLEKVLVASNVSNIFRNGAAGIFALSPDFVKGHPIVNAHVIPNLSLFGGSMAVSIGFVCLCLRIEQMLKAIQNKDMQGVVLHGSLSLFFAAVTLIGALMIANGSQTLSPASLQIVGQMFPIVGFVIYGAVGFHALYGFYQAHQFSSQLGDIEALRTMIKNPAAKEKLRRMTSAACIEMIEKSTLAQLHDASSAERILQECKKENQKRQAEYGCIILISLLGLFGFGLLTKEVDPSFIFAATGLLWNLVDASWIRFHVGKKVAGPSAHLQIPPDFKLFPEQTGASQTASDF